jgi:2-oxoglutarate ferredoxin oxidoreductase subunit alpha
MSANADDRILMKGNEALAEGAVRAGCRFFAGYPITPQNEVPEYMSWRLDEVGGQFVQAESEIAAVNMLFGAACMGVRTMTSSSSPGISLKQEGISYAAGARLPIFYANVMRGGPGLGNIAPAQGDYYQATRGGGHGDYRVFVMAPNSVEEMANFPRACYEIGFKYRIPTMVLADGILGQMVEGLRWWDDPIDPDKLPEPDWALGDRSGRDRRVISSYDLAVGGLEKMTLRLEKDLIKVEKNEARAEGFFTDDCELLVVAYGTAARISLSGVNIARRSGKKIGLLRPITLWPYPTGAINDALSNVKQVLVVEMSLGQMIDDVRLAVEGRVPVHLHGRPSGGIPTGEEIAEVISRYI